MVSDSQKLFAISLWQPWASFVVLGIKRIETRSWATHYRGRLYIHASRHKVALRDYWTATRHCEEWRQLHSTLGYGYVFPLGAIIGRVEVVGVEPTESIVKGVGALERALGDYTRGRKAWRLRDAQASQAVPCRGKPGIFSIEDIVAERVLAADLAATQMARQQAKGGRERGSVPAVSRCHTDKARPPAIGRCHTG